MKNSSPTTITAIFAALLKISKQNGHLSLKDALEQMDGRIFGILFLLLALPNTLPIPSPPGLSGVTGIPIILLGAQMMLGRTAPWLPKRIMNYQMTSDWCERITTKAQPTIDRVEKLLHPRLEWIGEGLWLRLIGFLIILLGALLSLPVPFGNILPSIPIAIMALGNIERDGYFIAAGFALGIAVTLGMTLFWSEVIFSIVHNLF
jgi:hypothetical protein